MPRLKNRFNIPSIPAFWTDPSGGTRIEWRTASETFIQWCGKVRAFCDGNGKEYPGDDALDELACTQFPRTYCTGDRAYHAPHMVHRSGGCGACGRR